MIKAFVRYCLPLLITLLIAGVDFEVDLFVDHGVIGQRVRLGFVQGFHCSNSRHSNEFHDEYVCDDVLIV